MRDCIACNRQSVPDKVQHLVCVRCTTKTRQHLADLPALHKEAHYCLQPQRGGHGTNTGEPTIGVNVAALDFVTGNRILNTLHQWERVVRGDRKLTPPALIPKKPTLEAEIIATVTFNIRHLDWITEQAWADEYIKDINEVHQEGMSAAKRHLEPTKRIPCPTTRDNDELCNFPLALQGDDLTQTLTCKRCKTSWTPARLIAVALSTPGMEIWIDSEALAEWYGLSQRQVLRIVKACHIPRRGSLIEWVEFHNTRLDK